MLALNFFCCKWSDKITFICDKQSDQLTDFEAASIQNRLSGQDAALGRLYL